MSPEEMRARSSEKVKQVMSLMKTLNIRVEAREKIDTAGFIEKMVFWIDEEKYPAAEPATPTGEAQEAPAQATEVGPQPVGDSSPENV